MLMNISEKNNGEEHYRENINEEVNEEH